MSTNKAQAPISGFPHGLNTQASAINVLPSEMMDGSINVELLENGSVRRRRGVDFVGANGSGDFLHDIVTAGVLATYPNAHSPSATYVRLSAPNGDLVEKIVVCVDNEFLVFLLTADGVKDFSTPAQTLTLGTHVYTDQRFYNVAFAQSGEKVYFAGRHLQPGYLSVDTDNTSLIVTHFDVIVRDQDSTSVNARVKNTITGDVRLFDCINGHTSAAATEPGVGVDWEDEWIEIFEPVPTWVSAWVTSTAYLTNLTRRYDSSATADAATLYPTAVAFYSGRVLLGGDPLFPNQALFSQVVERDEHISRYHSVADPLQINDSQIVDGDGGVITIQGTGLIYQMIAVSNSIFIGSNTGIVQVKGSGTDAFSATAFEIKPALTDRVNGPTSMVKLDQELMIYGEDAIWLSHIETSVASSTLGSADFINITDGRLTDWYRAIPKDRKASALAIYNGSERLVHYFFQLDETDLQSTRNNFQQPLYFTHVLSFDTRFLEESGGATADQAAKQLAARNVTRLVQGAFYLYKMADNGLEGKPYMAYSFVAPSPPDADRIVVDLANDLVVDGSSNQVVAAGPISNVFVTYIIIMSRIEPSTVTIQGAIGLLKGDLIKDWGSDSSNAVSFTSRALFGTQTFGDVLHKKGGIYVTFVMRIVDNANAFLRQAFNFADSVSAPTYSDQIKIYYPDRWGFAIEGTSNVHYDHTWFKHRVRGRGNVLQFIIENDADKDFHLLGYNHQYWSKTD